MLDVSIRAGVLELLNQLRSQGLTILLITHDLAIAATYADRIAVMYLGRIVEEGPARQVVEDPRHPYTIALLAATPSGEPSDRLASQIVGEIPDPSHIPSGCRFHPRCPEAFERCSRDEPRPVRVTKDHQAECFLANEPGRVTQAIPSGGGR
jgi:oligopeptide/dipeptide ABC transporter ATP-binding protein